MEYFNQDFIDFFAELEKNNNKDWFDNNRKRYAKSVKEPFKNFTALMISHISQIDNNIALQPKDAIFRINRDIRFSKDKTPYKTNVSAVIAPNGKKDYTYPGLYYELRADGIGIFGGVWGAEKEDLYRIRTHIAANKSEFFKAIECPQFKKYYKGEILGERNKVVPKELKEAATDNEYILNKQWYYKSSLSKSTILSDKLDEILVNHYLAASKFRKLILSAI